MKLLRIEPSRQERKKLRAVWDDGTTTNFGGRGCRDYTTYCAEGPVELARAKRRAYIARHGAAEKWRDPAAPATLSRYLLWEKPTLRGALAAYRTRFGV